MFAPFYRRLLALFYDSLLVCSLWIIASLIIIIFVMHGKPIPIYHPFHKYYQMILFGIVFCFFVGFWAYGGQTAGMRAWRLQVVLRKNKIPPSPLRAGFRFLLMIITQACGGSGWLWMLLDPERQALYDRLTGTEMVLLPEKRINEKKEASR